MSEQLETEQYLIATLLVKPENLYRYDIKPEQMLHLGGYLEAIQQVFQRTGQANPIVVADQIVANNPTQNASAFRQNLIDYLAMAVSADAGGYVDWLRNSHQIRMMAAACQAVISQSLVYGTKAEDLYSLMSQAVSETGNNATYQPQAEVLQDWISRQKQSAFTPTGLHLLDMALEGGMHDGNTYGLAGYAKAGKTMLAGTISGNMARAGVKHMYVALEMGGGAIESRTIARNLNMTNRRLKNEIKLGRSPVTADMAHRITHYLNAPGITWPELRQQMVIALHRDGIRRFIIDYWQLIANVGRKDDHQHWADTAQGISDFNKKYGTSTILVAQLNDDGKTLGSRGLVRACDMLLNIEFCKDQPTMRWLSMRATRETEQADLGSETVPYLEIDKNGPHMRELQINA